MVCMRVSIGNILRRRRKKERERVKHVLSLSLSRNNHTRVLHACTREKEEIEATYARKLARELLKNQSVVKFYTLGAAK